MSRNPGRPLSPHLTIWKWGPHMLVSILHRATGISLALGAAAIFVWWLTAAAMGPSAYARFLDVFTVKSGKLNIVGAVFAIGLTWTFLQHMFSGIRHLVLDTGAGYELRINKLGAIATIACSTILTVLIWAMILVRH
jgi:succinate dehydrogenase / fumarate reductase cytochrome b subunit